MEIGPIPPEGDSEWTKFEDWRHNCIIKTSMEVDKIITDIKRVDAAFSKVEIKHGKHQ